MKPASTPASPTPVPCEVTHTPEHVRLDAFLASARMFAAARRLEEAARVLEQFQDELARHLRTEETETFAAYARVTGEGERVSIYRLENRELARCTQTVLERLREGDADEAAQALDRLAGLLVWHELKEERIMLPRIQAA